MSSNPSARMRSSSCTGASPRTRRGSPSVLLLTPASERPALETLKKLEHQYSLRDELDSAWAVRPFTLSELRGQTTLVLEDPGGETLDQLLQAPMEMTQFLCFAIGLATALSGLRKRDLIHKDVKPANVLVSSATGRVRLMGFGIASRLPRERHAPKPPEFLAGTLPYGPEQTGRMNRESLGSFAAAALISLFGSIFTVWALHVAFTVTALLGLLAGTVGVAGLVVGCTMMVQETRLAVQSLAEETRLEAHPIDNP